MPGWYALDVQVYSDGMPIHRGRVAEVGVSELIIEPGEPSLAPATFVELQVLGNSTPPSGRLPAVVVVSAENELRLLFECDESEIHRVFHPQ